MQFKSVLFLTFLATVPSSFSLNCWNCNSMVEYCDDPFQGNSSNGKLMWECKRPQYSSFRESERPVCLKLTIFYTISNASVTHRKCYLESEGTSIDACRNKQIEHGRVEFCQTCTTDGCNKGSTFGLSTRLVLLCWFLSNI